MDSIINCNHLIAQDGQTIEQDLVVVREIMAHSILLHVVYL